MEFVGRGILYPRYEICMKYFCRKHFCLNHVDLNKHLLLQKAQYVLASKAFGYSGKLLTVPRANTNTASIPIFKSPHHINPPSIPRYTNNPGSTTKWTIIYKKKQEENEKKKGYKK